MSSIKRPSDPYDVFLPTEPIHGMFQIKKTILSLLRGVKKNRVIELIDEIEKQVNEGSDIIHTVGFERHQVEAIISLYFVYEYNCRSLNEGLLSLVLGEDTPKSIENEAFHIMDGVTKAQRSRYASLIRKNRKRATVGDDTPFSTISCEALNLNDKNEMVFITDLARAGGRGRAAKYAAQKEKALHLFNAGGYPSAKKAANAIAPIVGLEPSTVEAHINKYRKKSRKRN